MKKCGKEEKRRGDEIARQRGKGALERGMKGGEGR